MLRDLVGQKFGRLTVQHPIMVILANGKSRIDWFCGCDCGGTCTAQTRLLRSGKKKSCGCLKLEAALKNLPDTRLEYGQAAFKRLVRKYKASAKARYYDFNLSEAECYKLFTSDCFYCGVRPLQAQQDRNYHGVFLYNGIDRLDNDEGYVTGNCVPCCKACNFAKGTLDYADFLALIRRVYEHSFPPPNLYGVPDFVFVANSFSSSN